MKYIICDIDGTIAKMSPDRHFTEYDKVYLDTPIDRTIHLILVLCDECGYKPIFITGRKDDCRDITGKWLNKHITRLVDYSDNPKNLYMRRSKLPNGKPDHRPDYIVKKELLNQALLDYNINKNQIIYVFEDRLRCVKMWNDEGFFVIDVSQGKGDF